MDFRPELGRETVYELNRCFRCSFCRSQCPIYHSKLDETWNARGRMMAIQLLREGKIKFDKEILDRIYTCALCKSCEEICPGLVKVTDIVRETRRQLVEKKIGPLPEQLTMLHNINQTGNILGKARPPELQSLIDELPQQAETILYMGCVAQYVYPNHLISMFKVLREMGTEFTVLQEETCCGNYLADLGLKEKAEEAMMKTVRMLKEYRPEMVVTLCPMCYNAFKNDLPKLEDTPKLKVKHSTQILEEALESGRLKVSRRLEMRLVYKDPCHLGRYAEIFDAPRNIMRKIGGVKLVELNRTREFSRCCGGTIRVPYSDLRNSLCQTIFDEVLEAKADAVATSCPTCFHNLYSTAPYSIKGVFDVVEILAYAVGQIERIEDLTGFLE
ncbi:MAG: (Fe-S)-binding protein [Candidatus Bathyarchaeia archaeon]